MRPAGRTLQQNDSFPINESIALFVQFRGRVAQKVMPVFDLVLCLLPLWWCLTKYPRILMLWMGPPPWMASLVH